MTSTSCLSLDLVDYIMLLYFSVEQS